jgi:hypothetical protein
VDYPIAETAEVDGGEPDAAVVDTAVVDTAVADTVVVESDNGGYLAFTDADHDGDADLMVELDEHGAVQGAARFDQTTGEWVPVDPSELDESSSDTAG